MCGRYATTRSSLDLSSLFDAADETGGGLAADYNVAPTDPVPIVRRSRRVQGRVLSVARWGLVPSWARSTTGAARMINARIETVATTRAYAPSLRRRRCLLPADGWYEWRKVSTTRKRAYFMTPADGGVLAFAGLWSAWSGDGGDGARPLLTCTVLTTAAIGEFAVVHDRMPLLLPPERWAYWLDDDDEAPFVEPGDEYLSTLEIRPVGPAVGDVRNDGPGLIERIPAAPLCAPTETPVDMTLF